MNKKGFASIVVIIGIILVVGAAGFFVLNRQPSPAPEVPTPIWKLLIDKEARREAYPESVKVDSQIFSQIISGSTTQKIDTDQKGRILIDIRTSTSTSELVNIISSVGGEIMGNYPKDNTIYAWVPVQKILEIARRPDVKFIGRMPKATTN